MAHRKIALLTAAALLLSASAAVWAGGGQETSGAAIALTYARGGTVTDSPENPRVKAAIEAKLLNDTGLKVDLQPVWWDWDSIIEKYNLAIAGGTAPDTVRFWGSQHFQNWFAGHYIDITSLAAKYAPNMTKRFSAEEVAASKVKGVLTGLPLGGKPVTQVLLIRQDKLTKYGLAMPKTLADLENVMKVYKANEPDNFPWMGYYSANLAYIAGLAGLENVTDQPYVRDDGKVTTSYLSPVRKRYIELYARWYANGWVPKDSMTAGEEAEALYMKGHGLTVVSYVQYGLDFFNKIKETDPGVVGAVVPQLTTPWGDKTLALAGFNAEGYLGIPRTTKADHAAAVMQYYNWELASMENFQMGKLGQKDIDYFVQNGKLGRQDKWKAQDAKPYNWEHYIVNDPFLAGGDLQPLFLDDYAASPEVYSQIRRAKYVFNPIKNTPYLPSGDLTTKLQSVNAKLGELETQIITGRRPLADWDQASGIWADGGGADIEAAWTKVYNDLVK